MKSEERQSLEHMIRDLLRGSSSGYALESITYGDAVEMTLGKGEERFVLWLRRASDPTAFYKQTGLFKIGYLDAPPDRSGYALLDSIHAQVHRWEQLLPDGAVSHLLTARAASHPHLEILAVRAGLKPACRLVLSPETAAELVPQVRADGLYAHVTEGAAFVARFCAGFREGDTVLVYIGSTEQAARKAAQLERIMVKPRWFWRSTVGTERALGAALGYPPCCIEAFLRVRDQPNDLIRFHALARTPATAAWLLNDVDQSQSLISHMVCRYDCSASIRYAQALVTELARLYPAQGNVKELALSGLVVRFREGGALRLQVRPGSSAARHLVENIDEFGSSPSLHAWQAALGDADEVELGDGELRILGGDRRSGNAFLPAPPADMQIRLFGR